MTAVEPVGSPRNAWVVLLRMVNDAETPTPVVRPSARPPVRLTYCPWLSAVTVRLRPAATLAPASMYASVWLFTMSKSIAPATPTLWPCARRQRRRAGKSNFRRHRHVPPGRYRRSGRDVGLGGVIAGHLVQEAADPDRARAAAVAQRGTLAGEVDRLRSGGGLHVHVLGCGGHRLVDLCPGADVGIRGVGDGQPFHAAAHTRRVRGIHSPRGIDVAGAHSPRVGKERCEIRGIRGQHGVDLAPDRAALVVLGRDPVRPGRPVRVSQAH